MPYKDSEKEKENVKKRVKTFRKNHPERAGEASRRWRQRHPEKVKARHQRYSKTQACKDLHRAFRERLKLEVLTHCGPDGKLGCCWQGCAVVDIDMLTLDHKNNDGGEKRREFGQDSNYRRAKQQGYPDDLQTLCMNHQWKKKMEAYRLQRGTTCHQVTTHKVL